MITTKTHSTSCSSFYYKAFISPTISKKSNNQTFESNNQTIVKIKAMNQKNKYVFIVDSSITSANWIFSALGDVTNILKVDHAANGKDALQKININPPNAILLDVLLPDINVKDMLKQLKEKHPAMAVIILTEFPTPQCFKVCKSLGVTGYYDKTNELDMVIEHLQKLTN